MTDSQPTILVIEDEEAIRKFLRVSLSAQGYRLVEAANAEQGLLEAATAQPDRGHPRQVELECRER